MLAFIPKRWRRRNDDDSNSKSRRSKLCLQLDTRCFGVRLDLDLNNDPNPSIFFFPFPPAIQILPPPENHSHCTRATISGDSCTHCQHHRPPILCLQLDCHLIGIKLDLDRKNEENRTTIEEEEDAPEPDLAFVIDFETCGVPLGMGFFRLPSLVLKKTYMVGGEMLQDIEQDRGASDLVYEFDPFRKPYFKAPPPGTIPPQMRGPKAQPVVEIYGDRVYLLHNYPLLHAGNTRKEPTFEVLELQEADGRSWRWRALPPPPFHSTCSHSHHVWLFDRCGAGHPSMFFHCVIGRRLVISLGGALVLFFDFQEECWVTTREFVLCVTNLEKRIHVVVPPSGKCIPCDFPGFDRGDGSRVVVFLEFETRFLCAYVVDDGLRVSAVQVMREVFPYAQMVSPAIDGYKLFDLGCGRMCAVLQGFAGFLEISIFEISFREDCVLPLCSKGGDSERDKPFSTFPVLSYQPSLLPETEFLQVRIVKEYCYSIHDFFAKENSIMFVDAFFL